MQVNNLIRKKILLVYNPNSGNGLFINNLDYIISRCQKAGYRVIPLRATGDFSMDEVFREIKESGRLSEYREVIAAGGDGTINICVNAMVKNDIHMPLAIFPAGTANDFAQYFNLSDDIEKMVDIALSDNLVAADIGKVNDKYFINVAAIGPVVDVSQKTDPTLKNTIGIFAYYLKGLTEIHNLKPKKVVITTPGRVYREKMYFMVVMNGTSAGGFRNLSPSSDVGDGKLDVVLFRNMNIFEMPALFIKILQGKHPSSKRVLHLQTNSLKIESEENLPTDIDGEHGEAFPLEFTVIEKRLRVFAAPADAKE